MHGLWIGEIDHHFLRLGILRDIHTLVVDAQAALELFEHIDARDELAQRR